MNEAEQLAERVASLLFGEDEIVPEQAIQIIVVSILESRPMRPATSAQLHEIFDVLTQALMARNAAIIAARSARFVA